MAADRSDRLNELLGLKPASHPEPAPRPLPLPTRARLSDAEVEKISADALQSIQGGAPPAEVVNSIERAAHRAGFEDGSRQIAQEFESIRRRYGDDFARNWLRWQRDEAKKRLPEYRRQRKEVGRRLAFAKAGYDHVLALKAAREAGFVLRHLNYQHGINRLLAHEVLEQINDDLLCPLLRSPLIETSDLPGKGDFLELHRFLMRAEKFDLRSLQPHDVKVNADFSRDLERESLLMPPFPAC